jgi:GT2 family glycosyltransferase
LNSSDSILSVPNELVSIIIVTAGRNNYLERCLKSLELQTYPDFEIIVIDNSSNRDFVNKTLSLYPGIKLYSSPKNLFYCAAVNKGIEMSGGEFILCLNDDAFLEKDFIEQALRGFRIGGSVGLVSGKILRTDKETLDSTGLSLSFFRTAKERGYGVTDRGQFEKEGHIFGVNGAVAFYRKEMLEDIKEGKDYLDADFRFFYEDLDIAWRANRRGWKGYYIPSAIAYHARGCTARPAKGIGKPYSRRFLSDELHADLIKNRYITMLKNESLPDFLLHLPGIALYDCVAWGYCLLFKPQMIKFFIYNLKYLEAAIKKREF